MIMVILRLWSSLLPVLKVLSCYLSCPRLQKLTEGKLLLFGSAKLGHPVIPLLCSWIPTALL